MLNPMTRPSTLHEAMLLILTEAEEPWLNVNELTKRINEEGLYRMRDGRKLKPGQVHARANDYSHLFEKEGSQVRCRFRLTSEIKSQTAGSYSAAEVQVTRLRDQSRMSIETRVAYTALAGVESPNSHVMAMAMDRARWTLLYSGFETGDARIHLLTTQGWQAMTSPDE